MYLMSSNTISCDSSFYFACDIEYLVLMCSPTCCVLTDMVQDELVGLATVACDTTMRSRALCRLLNFAFYLIPIGYSSFIRWKLWTSPMTFWNCIHVISMWGLIRHFAIISVLFGLGKKTKNFRFQSLKKKNYEYR